MDFLDTIVFSIPATAVNQNQAGRNRFSLMIDPGNPKEELDTINNFAGFEVTIPWKGVDIIFPKAFSITPIKEFTLQMLSYQAETGVQYLVELDTSYLMNSPAKVQWNLNPKNGYYFKKHKLDDFIGDQDTMTFYLRAQELGDSTWAEVSFSYYKGSEEGWAQGEFGQYLKNQSTGGLYADSIQERFFFKEFSSQIELLTAGGAFTDPEDLSQLKIAGSWIVLNGPLQEKECKENRLNFVRINRFTGLPLRNLVFSDPRSCGVSPMAVKSFTQSDINDTILTKFLGSISSDELLLFYSVGSMDYGLWGSKLLDSLAVFGLDSTLIQGLDPNQAMAFLGNRNWTPGQSIFSTADTNLLSPLDSQLVALNELLTISNEEGGMLSTLIGPSVQWKRLNNTFVELELADQLQNQVFGIHLDGRTEFLFNASLGETDISTLVPASDFPYLFINSKISDSLNRTAAQFKHWGVTFDSPPDGYLRIADSNQDSIDQVFEGQEFKKGSGSSIILPNHSLIP